MGEYARESLLRENKPKRSIYHNCSGKHLGLMTLCKGIGEDKSRYYRTESDVQREIKEYIGIMTQYPVDKICTGVDGCGVPVFAVPLKYMANAYLRMACPDLIEDEKVRNAVIKIVNSMNKNYKYVSGTDKICSLLSMDSNIVAKGGAIGTYCFALKNERLGFAIKVMDGSEDEWPLIVASILDQIDYKNKDTINGLYKAFPSDIKNDNGIVVGINKVVFKL